MIYTRGRIARTSLLRYEAWQLELEEKHTPLSPSQKEELIALLNLYIQYMDEGDPEVLITKMMRDEDLLYCGLAIFGAENKRVSKDARRYKFPWFWLIGSVALIVVGSLVVLNSVEHTILPENVSWTEALWIFSFIVGGFLSIIGASLFLAWPIRFRKWIKERPLIESGGSPNKLIVNINLRIRQI